MPKKEAEGKRVLSDEERAKVKELFDGFDADGSGSIELDELQEAGWGKEGTVEGDSLIELFERHDVEGNGSLNLEQFTDLVQASSSPISP